MLLLFELPSFQVLYAELWLDPLNRTGQQMETTATENLTGLVFGDEPPERSMAHDLLFRAYSNIGEPDGFTGFQSLMSSPAWDIRRYEQEGTLQFLSIWL